MTNQSSENSHPSNGWLRLYRYRLYLLAVLFVAIGLALIVVGLWVVDPKEWWLKALSEVGIASIIAGLLMVGSERYLKEGLFSEIETKISATLDSFRVTAFDLQQYGRLPAPLRERLRDRILGAPVIQRDVTYKYELSKVQIDDEPAYRASVTACSVYVNLSAERQRPIVKESLPAFSFQEKQSDYGFQKITSMLKGKGEFPSDLVPQVIQNYVSSREAGPTLFMREAALDSGAELNVKFEGVAYLGPDDWISLEAFLPTINMACVTSGPDLKFSGQAGDALSDIWQLTPGNAREDRWELKGGILPGQGFDLWFEDDDDKDDP